MMLQLRDYAEVLLIHAVRLADHAQQGYCSDCYAHRARKGERQEKRAAKELARAECVLRHTTNATHVHTRIVELAGGR